MAHELVAHPDTPPASIHGVGALWSATTDGRLILRWRVKGAQALLLPSFAGKGRADELWRTTCFELFLMDGESGRYREFNFSPSQRWAAYRFTGYREGMAEAPLEPAPEISPAIGDQLFVLTATIPASLLEGASAAGLSAVIEEKDGTKSYWALAHPPGKPDFHHPACFTLPLAPPDAK